MFVDDLISDLNAGTTHVKHGVEEYVYVNLN